MHSINKVDDNIQKIGALFPNCITERKNSEGKVEYAVDFDYGNLDSIVLIGPEESLDKITADDIQIEINVSSLNLARIGAQTIEVSNISIQSDEVEDCWVYGKYTAKVSASMK